MKKTYCLIPFLCLGLFACAPFSEQHRLNQFNETAHAYRRALLDGNFQAAAQFINPAVRDAAVDYGPYKNIKVVEYKITHTDVADDKHRIEQDVELTYFLLNRNIVKSTQTHQRWQFQPMRKVWLLETKLPVFEQ
jgi:hypothetical protein